MEGVYWISIRQRWKDYGEKFLLRGSINRKERSRTIEKSILSHMHQNNIKSFR